jgi:hypothetical protein
MSGIIIYGDEILRPVCKKTFSENIEWLLPFGLISSQKYTLTILQYETNIFFFE